MQNALFDRSEGSFYDNGSVQNLPNVDKILHGRRPYTSEDLEEARLRDLTDLGRRNYSVSEDPIIDLARSRSREIPLPVFSDVSPFDYLRSYAPTRGSNHQTKHSKITLGTTASERAEITRLACLDGHGKKSIKSEERTKTISWGFSANETECSPFWLTRSDGSPDVELHSNHHVKANRSHCDRLGCSSPMCCELTAREKAENVSNKIDLVERASAMGGGKSQVYHVFVSPPQEEGKKWIVNSAHFEEMSRIVSAVMERGLGMTAYSVALHPWRGRKDRDRSEALQYVGEASERSSSDSPYFWRFAPHFHVLGIVSGMVIKSERYLRKFCKEFYNLTGWIVHIKPVKENPNRVWKYVLTHVGIGHKEGAKRALPAFRNYGMASPRGINKVDLGHISKVRPCPICGEQCEDLHGGPSSVRSKFHGYAFKSDKKILLEKIDPFLERSNFEVGPDQLETLLRMPELYIPRRSIPRYVLPPEVLGEVSEEASEESPVTVREEALGHVYDTMELAEFLGYEPHTYVYSRDGPRVGRPGTGRVEGGPEEA